MNTDLAQILTTTEDEGKITLGFAYSVTSSTDHSTSAAEAKFY